MTNAHTKTEHSVFSGTPHHEDFRHGMQAMAYYDLKEKLSEVINGLDCLNWELIEDFAHQEDIETEHGDKLRMVVDLMSFHEKRVAETEQK